MTRGIYISDSGVIGGEFSVKAEVPPCVESILRSVNGKIAPGTAIGIGLDRIKTKQIFTEETNPEKIEEILKLQREYLKADSEQVSFISRKAEKGTGILTITTAQPEISGRVHVYPVHAALYALAYRRNIINPGSNTLILFFSGATVLSLAVEGESIVFARSFPDDGELDSNIRFSSQSVYFVKQRHFIDIDKTLVISENHDDAEKIEKLRSGNGRVEFLDTSGYFPDRGLSGVERASMVLAYGVSLASGIDQIAEWSFGNASETKWKKKGILLRCAALLLAAGPLIYGADILSNKFLIARLDKKAAALAPIASRVSEAIADVNILKSFAAGEGRKLIGPDICFELFSEIDKARGSDLYLTSIAGSPYGTISVNGTAGSYPSVLKFIEHLGTSEKVGASELIYANMADSGSVDFQLVVKYKFPMEFRSTKANGEDSEGQ